MQAPDWFKTVIERLVAAYPSWPCHAGTIQVFWDSLEDLPRQEVERATIAYIAQETAWPVVAKLRSIALLNHDDNTLTASQAWDEMYRHRHAHTRAPKWSSPAVESAARAVSWNDPCWLTEQIPTIRAQFERYYNAMAAREKRNSSLLEGERLYRLSGWAKDTKALSQPDYEEDNMRPGDRPYLKTDDVDPKQPDDVDDA